MNKELTPGEIIDLLNKKVYELSRMNMQLDKWANEKDKAESMYQQELSKELLRLRSEKVPLVIIKEVAKGNMQISKLRYQREFAKSSYILCINKQKNLRSEIETLRSQLAWLRVEYGNS